MQINKWRENSEDEIHYSTVKKELWQFSTNLAIEMSKEEMTNINYEEEG